MIFNLVKKQLLLIIRNRQNFTLLLAMPLVLVFIIKFAIGDLMHQDVPEIDAAVAIVEHTNEEEDIQRLVDELMLLPMEEGDKEKIKNNLSSFQPIQILKDQVFGHEQLKEMFTLEEITPEEIEKAKQEELYTAIIEVPAGFSYELVKSTIFNGKSDAQLTLYVDQGEDFVANIVKDLLLTFEEQMHTSSVLERNGLADLMVMPEDIKGEIHSISKVDPVSGTTYYAVGMSVMFVLYIASTMGSYAFEEKRIHVFDRILLANVSRWIFFTGTFFASAIIALAQLFILYGFCAVIFGVHWPNVTHFLLISLGVSLAVGGIASLLTAINYRFQSETASTVFSSVIITVFAFLGGSFYPVGNLSELVKFLGDLTPNGAGMSAYLTSAQGYGFSEIYMYLIYLLLFTVVMILAAVWTFPKRGKEA
ncbi:ABC-2 type transport system permease protein [Salirhabdus euzebyi]|uniref:ABC-2 type transport system permease protein n=1 Tax=Salirhabdus euzebyi TaxID=394506 RepID=A0A841Q9J6_9BACI|nr:ABC transporter permease [Salirhabdus euzebyi]MBB6455066.1 ABC-2 type transport system permease protein [Salirhabdus euzebyi]